MTVQAPGWFQHTLHPTRPDVSVYTTASNIFSLPLNNTKYTNHYIENTMIKNKGTNHPN